MDTVCTGHDRRKRSCRSSFPSPLSELVHKPGRHDHGGAPFDMHVVDLDTADLGVGDEIVFTLYWNEQRRWDGQDFRVTIV
jgi:hypothetical protein